MASEINDKTRIPLAWVFGFIAFFITVVCGLMAGAILYVSDLRLKTEVNTVEISNVKAAQQQSASEMKEQLAEIKADLKELIRGFRAKSSPASRYQ